MGRILNGLTTVVIVAWSCFCISVALFLVFITTRKSFAFWMGRQVWAPGLLKIARIELDILGLENLDLTRPQIFILNHQSGLDIPAAFAALPVDLHFIAKKELKRVPFIGWYMQAVGMIFVDRNNSNQALTSLKEAGKLIRHGKSVLAFPEGTRSRNGKILPFKKGIFAMAIEAQVPLVPVALFGGDRSMPYGSFGIKPGQIRLLIGQPIEISKMNVKERNQIADHVRKEVTGLFETLSRDS